MARLKTYLATVLASLSLTYCTAPIENNNDFNSQKIIEFTEKEIKKDNSECVFKPVIGDFNRDGLYDICFPGVPFGGLTCAIDWNMDCMQDLVVWTSTNSYPKIYRGNRKLTNCQPSMYLNRRPNYKTAKY